MLPWLSPKQIPILFRIIDNYGNNSLFEIIFLVASPPGNNLIHFNDMNVMHSRNCDHKTRSHHFSQLAQTEENPTLIVS